MIKQAIIPLAGLGTRLLPLTSVMPKELLPINGKPNLEYILDECLEAGIKEFIFIISKKKSNIKKYFFNDVFYKKIIKKKNDKRIIEEFKKIKKYQKMIKFVYQNNPKGTGDAVLKCRKYIKDKFFLMLLPDDLIINKNCSKEMISLHKKTKGSIIATKRVDKKTVSRWGILSIKDKKKNHFKIKDVVEKPNNPPSNLAIGGIYVFDDTFWNRLDKVQDLPNFSISDVTKQYITEGIAKTVSVGENTWIDCGTPESLLRAGQMVEQGVFTIKGSF